MRAETIVVAGTDTGLGKTVFAAALTLALDGCYWKPVQAGVDPDGATDTTRVRALTGLPVERFLKEAYVLKMPLSAHHAAGLDGVAINPQCLSLPSAPRPLVVELAGGLLVPLRGDLLQADLIARWAAPIVLCARTTLGTINHTLLSVEALKSRKIPLLGIAFIGDPQPETEAAIERFSGARRLGRLSLLPHLGPSELREAFDAGFCRADFFEQVTA